MSIPLAASAYPEAVQWTDGTEPSGFSSPLKHTPDAHPAEGLATLIDVYICPFPPFTLLLPLEELETIDLIPLQVMDAISAALEPAHDDGALPQVDVIPAQIASLRDPQTMAVDDQPDQPILEGHHRLAVINGCRTF